LKNEKENPMGKAVVGMIEEFGGQVEAYAGTGVAGQVMQGADQITAKTKNEAVSLWVKEAVERLDALAPETTCHQIMEACGRNCSRVNQSVIERAKARRDKFVSEDEFVAAEIRKPLAGTRLERDGNVLYQIYTPQSYTHPMRCYCGLLRALPEDQQVSQTYCHCSKAFVQALWQEVLGRPVTVELLESAITGSSECRFKIGL
jgi:hypothetical protein